MDTIKYKKYEAAVKHVKKIKDFHRHIIVYLVVNIIIIALGFKFVNFILETTPNPEQGFVNWVHINVWGTPVLWGIGLLIHGLFAYRFKFSFFKNWEERKIKELMEKEIKYSNEQ